MLGAKNDMLKWSVYRLEIVRACWPDGLPLWTTLTYANVSCLVTGCTAEVRYGLTRRRRWLSPLREGCLQSPSTTRIVVALRQPRGDSLNTVGGTQCKPPHRSRNAVFNCTLKGAYKPTLLLLGGRFQRWDVICSNCSATPVSPSTAKGVKGHSMSEPLFVPVRVVGRWSHPGAIQGSPAYTGVLVRPELRHVTVVCTVVHHQLHARAHITTQLSYYQLLLLCLCLL